MLHITCVCLHFICVYHLLLNKHHESFPYWSVIVLCLLIVHLFFVCFIIVLLRHLCLHRVFTNAYEYYLTC